MANSISFTLSPPNDSVIFWGRYVYHGFVYQLATIIHTLLHIRFSHCHSFTHTHTHTHTDTSGTKADPPVVCVCRKSPVPTKKEEDKKPHIKKPLNAFMLYMKEMRAKVVAECTLKESAAINQILGRRVSKSFSPPMNTHIEWTSHKWSETNAGVNVIQN